MFPLDAIYVHATALLMVLPAPLRSSLSQNAPDGFVQATCLAAAGDSSHSAEHPLPRVRVDVEKVQGPRDAGEVQAKLRASLWGNIVACYAKEAQHNQRLQGDALIRVEVDRAGKVIGTRKRGGDMPSAAVVSCWRRMLREVELPAAPRGASVDVRIWIAPGDEPVSAPRKRP